MYVTAPGKLNSSGQSLDGRPPGDALYIVLSSITEDGGDINVIKISAEFSVLNCKEIKWKHMDNGYRNFQWL